MEEIIANELPEWFKPILDKYVAIAKANRAKREAREAKAAKKAKPKGPKHKYTKKLYKLYPEEFNRELKLLIRRRDGFKCQDCGCPEEECETALHVHHIDQVKTNLNPDNLTSLCKGCHFKLHRELLVGGKRLTEV